MIPIVFIVCVMISTGSLGWGYWISGHDEAVRWIAAFGLFWLAAHWRKWSWFSAPAVFVALSFAAYGVWSEFVYGWMFNGAVFGVFAWNLTEFQQKLGRLPAREDKQGMKRRHLLRIGLLALGSMLITILLLWIGRG